MISNTSIALEAPDRFRYYGLRVNATQHLLPLGVELVVDQIIGYSMLLAYNRMNNQVITAAQFSPEELPALSLLCSSWPSMVSYELLVTALHPAPEAPIVAYQIEDARNANTLEQLLAPLTRQIDGYRQRLRELGLDVREVEKDGRSYGYRLIQSRPNGGYGVEVMRES
jgi:hypothetical protein